MLTREENRYMTETGPGMPMGDLCAPTRWHPVLLSEELSRRRIVPR